MQDTILHDVRRKILGTYMNAEANSINSSHKEILSVRLDEKLFDTTIHKAITRAFNKLHDENLSMCGFTVQDLLEKHNMLSSLYNENEFVEILSDAGSTPKQFNRYLEMIIEHKLGL